MNEKVTSNKTKHLEVEKKLTDLRNKAVQISEKGFDFFLGRMYFTKDNDYQNFSVFASILTSLILGSNKKVTNWV